MATTAKTYQSAEDLGTAVRMKYPEKFKGLTDQQIGESMLRTHPELSKNIKPSAPVSGGGFGKVVKDITSPFLRMGASASGVIEGLGSLGGAAIASATGNKQAAKNLVAQAGKNVREGGAVGRVTGAKPISTIKDTVGVAGQLAPYVIGTGEVKAGLSALDRAGVGLAKKTLTSIGRGAAVNAAGGTLAGAGTELMRPGSTAGSIAGQGLVGGAVGGVVGGALEGLGSLVAGGVQKVSPFVSKVAGAEGRSALAATGSRMGEAVGTGIKRAAVGVKDFVDESARLNALKPEIIGAIKKGIPEAQAVRLSTASPETAWYGLDMIKAAKNWEKSNASVDYPMNVVGEAGFSPVKPLVEKLKSIGAELGMVKQNLAGKTVNISDTYQTFVDDLAKIGAVPNKDGSLTLVRGAKIDPEELRVLKDISEFLTPDNKGRLTKDALEIDREREYLFRKNNLAEKGQLAISDPVVNFIEKYRSRLLNDISTVDSKYGQLSRDYAVITKGLTPVSKKLKHPVADLENLPTADLKGGEILKRLGGAASADTKKMIDDLWRVAEQYGFRPNVDLEELLNIANTVEDMYGVLRSNALKGEVRPSMFETNRLRGGGGGILDTVISAAKKGVTPTKKETKQALEDLLRRAAENN